MQHYPNTTFDTHRAKEHFLEEISYSLGPVELKKMMENDLDKFNLIDMRSYQDYIDGHIPFAMHLPPEQIEEHWNMFEKEKINIIYCYNQYCKIAAKNALLVAEKGYPVMELCGGYHAWKEFFEFETITTDSPDEKNI